MVVSAVHRGYDGAICQYQGGWSWGGGWLSDAGFIDFAGSGIVHMCGAAAALAVILLGPRNGSTDLMARSIRSKALTCWQLSACSFFGSAGLVLTVDQVS